MNAVLVFLAFTCIGQKWDNPVIQEAELAPPSGISASANNAAPEAKPAEPAPPAAQAAELQWEYDEEGKPVARPLQDTKAAAPKKDPPAKSVAKEAAPQEPAPEKPKKEPSHNRGPKQAATFWFMLMKN